MIFGGIEWTLLDTKCVFCFSLQPLSETFFILRRIESDIIKKVCLLFMYISCYSCDILMKIDYSVHFFLTPNFMKIHRVGAESSHTYGWAWWS
jgi:hypothetical protein